MYVDDITILHIFVHLQAIRDIVASTGLIVDSVPFIVAMMNESARLSLSWSANETIRWCSFAEKPCDVPNDIVTYNDPVTGNCFTFNHEKVMSYKVKRAGQSQGVCLHVEIVYDMQVF